MKALCYWFMIVLGCFYEQYTSAGEAESRNKQESAIEKRDTIHSFNNAINPVHSMAEQSMSVRIFPTEISDKTSLVVSLTPDELVNYKKAIRDHFKNKSVSGHDVNNSKLVRDYLEAKGNLILNRSRTESLPIEQREISVQSSLLGAQTDIARNASGAKENFTINNESNSKNVPTEQQELSVQDGLSNELSKQIVAEESSTARSLPTKISVQAHRTTALTPDDSKNYKTAIDFFKNKRVPVQSTAMDVQDNLPKDQAEIARNYFVAKGNAIINGSKLKAVPIEQQKISAKNSRRVSFVSETKVNGGWYIKGSSANGSKFGESVSFDDMLRMNQKRKNEVEMSLLAAKDDDLKDDDLYVKDQLGKV